MEKCDWFIHSHGCDLAIGHDGDIHVCDPDVHEDQPGGYAGPTPEGGWHFGIACYVWPRGHADEFQQVRA